MSEKTLGEHLAEIMDVVGYVQKDAENKFHNYKYASADAVLSKVRKELSTRKIYIKRDTDKSGVKWTHVGDDGKINVIYDWVGWLVYKDKGVEICGTGQGQDKNDKAVMKAETAALKYAIAGAFLISWGDDPEADHEERASAKKAKSARAPKKPRGATKEDAVDIKPILEKLGEAKTVEELDKVAAAAKRLTIRESDRPALRDTYQKKKQELSK